MKIYSISQGAMTRYLDDLSVATTRAQEASTKGGPVHLREHTIVAGSRRDLVIATLNGEALGQTTLIDVYRDGVALPAAERDWVA